MSPVWAGMVNPGSPVSEDIGTQSSCHLDPAVSVSLCPSTPHRETRGNPDDSDHNLSPEHQRKSQNPIVSHAPAAVHPGSGKPHLYPRPPVWTSQPWHFVGSVEMLVKSGPFSHSARIRSGTTPIHCSPHPWATRLLNIMKWQFV